jgi:hypothetical protein
MAKHLISSNAGTIKAIKEGDPRSRLNDGDGLCLLLFVKGGSHSWRFDYTLDGRRKTISFCRKPRFSAPGFDVPAPERPAPKEQGRLDKLLSSRKTRIEDASRQAIARYEQELANWQRQQEDFNKAVARRKLLVERLIYESRDAMETFSRRVCMTSSGRERQASSSR